MIVNFGSKLDDIKQAVAGTWAVTTDKGWKCYELGKIKLFKKLCQEGNNVLPETFIKNRTDITPYMKFEKENMSGGVIGLQDQYITLESSSLVVILMI